MSKASEFMITSLLWLILGQVSNDWFALVAYIMSMIFMVSAVIASWLDK